MTGQNPLTLYLEERQNLLECIRTVLEKDSRIVAAWLTGSLGRGEGDEFSDLDMRVVVADAYIQEIVDQRRHFVTQIEEAVLFVEAPQNAPDSGGYLMAHYDAPVAPHQVDWSWQPLSLATRPNETLLLFDHIGLPSSDKPMVFRQGKPVKEIVERPLHFISFFWAMLMITGKHIVRFPWAEEMDLLPYVLGSIQQTQHFVGLESGLEVPPQHTPSSKLQILRQLAVQMQQLMPEVVGRGGQVPTAIVPGAHRFLDLVEVALENAMKE